MNAPRSPAEQAADWLIRHDRGLTPVEQDAFHAWLAADSRHGGAFARERATWRELDFLAEWRPEHGAEPNPDLLARPRRALRRKFFRLAPLAAAACLALIWLGPLRFATESNVAASAVASGYEKRILEDGSVIELNRGAAIVVAYTASERRVQLTRGEAHFTVAKNPDRPFIVRAGALEARAVGTAFNVRFATDAVEVLVTEGRVAVSGLGRVDPNALAAGTTPEPTRWEQRLPPAEITAGERATVSLADTMPPQIASVTPAEVARVLAWQPAILEFSSQPLAEVAAEFNRRNTLQLVLADPSLATMPIVATFRSDNVDGFVRLLTATAGLRAERDGQTISLHREKSR